MVQQIGFGICWKQVTIELNRNKCTSKSRQCQNQWWFLCTRNDQFFSGSWCEDNGKSSHQHKVVPPHFWVGPEPQPPIDISTIKINSLVVNQLSQLWDITLLEYWQDKLIRGDDEESGTSIVKDDEGRYTPCPIKPSVKTERSLNTSMCRQCRCGFSIWLYVVAQPRSVFLEHHCAPGRRSPAAQQPSKLHEQTALHKGLVEGCLPVFASQAETNGWGIEITKGLPLELKQRSQKFLVCLVLLVFVSSSWSSLCKSN